MNYNEFKNRVQQWPIVLSRDLIPPIGNKQVIRNQLERWCRKKLLIRLRRGAFLLNSNDRRIDPSRTYLANQLYAPSYVSLEYALNYYGLIPERVSDLTSITTKKTLRLKNEIGTFIYQHIKPQAFRGFKALKDDALLIYFIAEPEKAMVDFFYLNLEKFQGNIGKVFRDYYRLQNIEMLRPKKVMKFAGIFHNEKLIRVSQLLCNFIKAEGKK